MIKHVEERLTKNQLAERLAISPRSVDRYVASGFLRPERLPGGAVRFRASAIEAMIRESSRRNRAFFKAAQT